MLRVHFTDRDLARTVVASEPDPLWETVLGMHQFGGGVPVFGGWRRLVREDILRRDLAGPLRFVHTLAAPAHYFPDFLTPDDAAGGLRSGLTAIRRTPASRLREEVERTARARTLPAWAGALARGENSLLDQLVEALRLLHDVLVARHRDEIEAVLDPERQRNAREFLAGGMDGLLGSLSPVLGWQAPVLCSPYPHETDLHLDGRGIRLIPSYFCWRHPVVLANRGLPPVLVYPVERGHGWALGRDGSAALGALLGKTRAKVLRRLGSGASTGQLATRLGISAASASEHLTVLRESGLVRSQRDGQQVKHELTTLGELLLSGRE